MASQHSNIDFVAYDRKGQVLLLAEAKSRHGTSESWAARLRRNMLAHGMLPWAKYFLIATPERMYLWKQGRHDPAEVPPGFTIDAEKVFPALFPKTTTGAFEHRARGIRTCRPDVVDRRFTVG